MKVKESNWRVDSWCSRHMTGNAILFNKLKTKNREKLTFGDAKNAKAIGITHDSSFIKNVLLIDKLNYNLLSVSKLCDIGQYVLFKKFECIFVDHEYNIVVKGKRQNEIYVIDMNGILYDSIICLNVINEELGCGTKDFATLIWLL